MSPSPDSQINYGPEITFGCGTFLPGQGPFNLDDTTGGIDVLDIDTPLDGTGVPPGKPVDDQEIDFPPTGPKESTGPFGGGVITPGGQFTVGCSVPEATNFDETADGCDENDPSNFDCCEFLDGCPDPSFDNYLEGAWGCGGTYENQGNTDCCENEGPNLGNPVINLGNGDIVPGFGESGENYGEELFVDITLYRGSQNPTGELFSVFTPLKWDLNGAGVAVGGTFNANIGGYEPPVTINPPYFSRWAPTPTGFENILFQHGTGLIGMKNFTADFGPGVEWNGEPCNGIPLANCNEEITEAHWQCDWVNPWPAGECGEGGCYGFFFLTARIHWVDTLAVGAGDDGSTGSTLSIRNIIKRVGAGLLPQKEKDISQSTIISQALKDNRIDLNDPSIQASIMENNPQGLMDSDIAYTLTPKTSKMIPNNTGSSDLFNEEIDENLAYIVNNIDQIRDWDSTKTRGVTLNSLLRSLKPEARAYISKIKNYDGTPLTISQIFSMIGSRVLDGTLGNVNMKLLRKYAEASEALQNFDIIRSNSDTVNEVAALAYIERNYYSLDPARSQGKGRWILPNWKVFATDVDKHIEIRIANGDLKKFYIKDDNTLVDRSSIKVQDGDFVEVKVGGVLKRFFCKSEIDHAFLLPERVRMKAVSLLGGDPARTLSVSADVSSEIEFNYSLSSARQNFYVLSAVLSSVVTEPSEQGSYLLKNTTLTYQLMDTSTTSGLDEVNEYIRYKANSRIYTLDDDDRMLDYIESTGELQVKQTDILADAPKTIKATPLLVRQIPWYVIVYPTNRPEYNLLNSKSNLITYEKGRISSRTIRTGPTMAPEFNNGTQNTFAPVVLTGTDYPDAIGNYSTQNRITRISPDAKVYQTGYRKNNIELGSAQEVNPPKLKTTFRVIKEIITELNNNYILDWDSLGRSLTTFDVISRLNLKEFCKFLSIENYALLFPFIKKGGIENVKVFEPTAFTGARLGNTKTQLIQRRSTAGEDTFPPIKSMATGYKISSPTTAGPAFAAMDRQRVPRT